MSSVQLQATAALHTVSVNLQRMEIIQLLRTQVTRLTITYEVYNAQCAVQVAPALLVNTAALSSSLALGYSAVLLPQIEVR